MPKVNIVTTELSGGGIPTGTGTAFVAGVTDAGPPPGGPPFKACWSLTDFTNYFGPRSSTSSTVYDWLDEFYHDGGKVAYVTRVTDSTATTAALTLNDPSSNPSVVVSALTPGSAGNDDYIGVSIANGATFTANTAGPLSAPSGLTGTPASGGSFAAGTYFWKVTALNSNGETVGSNEFTTAVTSGQQVNLTWSAVSGASSYKIYRATAAGGESTSPALAGTSSSASFSDTGSAVSTGAVPATNTTGSTVLSNVSSFKSVGVGTPVSGAGIPSGAVVTTINTTAKTATLNLAATATATAVTITPSQATITVQDAFGDVIESHGPYYATSQLIADTTSAYVSFAQSTGVGATTTLPVAVSPAIPLAGGADATDLTDSSHVAALANFPNQLGPGTVALPGKTSLTAWQGLLSHAQENNRFAVMDMTDSVSSLQVIAMAEQLGTPPNASYGMFIQGSLIVPGILPGTTRTVPGSAAVAALRAQVASQANTAQAPGGLRWPLTYPLGFTTFFGPVPVGGTLAGPFQQADVDAMEQAGVNCFANYYGTLCLFGFVTPVSRYTDATFWQATATCERMALVADALAAMAQYLFDPIDPATITAVHGDLQAICVDHEAAGALFDLDGDPAYAVITDPPVNTAETAQAGQLNAQMYVRLTPYADTVNVLIVVTPVTQSVPVVTTNA